MTEPQRVNASIDQSARLSSAKPKFRLRLPLLGLALLLMSFLVGATALSDTSANFIDVAKVVAVLSFIASMIALALSMIGDSYRA